MNLKFEDYIVCFKKQFCLQKGKGGHRISAYYTNYNMQSGLKNDTWGIMVFIHCGLRFGFTDKEMLNELKISSSLYEILKDETPKVLSDKYPDVLLHKRVLAKIGLVNNSVLNTHFVKPVHISIADFL